ncbi:hypothetical protein N7373_07145 [Achromobacter mucicolens]|uniref:hypothetical protein n=1 Tax=Achromobacter mucicolens TaxID=1389922 RepID=UPI00244D4EEA|nr:hypothetical protein [Achromobacter mucicolens]MDH0091217.1 hypothetical protein [Achromobacter mucicolens]
MSRRKISCSSVLWMLSLLFAWALTWYFCRPVVVLHYSTSGESSIGYYYITKTYISKSALEPGESTRYATDWRQEADYWTMITFPAESNDSVEIEVPFSRVDVCIAPGAKVEWTEIRHGFFDRFTEPSEPCEPPTAKR